jgi:beta-galactosidase
LKKGDHNHPTHTNLLFHQILYNQPAVGADTWKMAKVVDTLGVSIYLWTQGGGDFPWCFSQIVDTVRSAAESEGKEAWVTELQGGPTIWAHSKSVTPSPKQIELWAWQTVARGGRGLIYWLWRPRIGNVHSGWENNEFGLVSKDGELRPRAEAAGKACRMITKNADLFLNARPNAKVAILQSQTCKNAAASEIPDETIFHPYEGQRRYYTQSQLGAYKILWEEKIPCDFINPPSIAAGMLNRYKVLIMPFTYMLDEPSANAIKSFVRKGGCVLADFGCAMKDEYGAVHITSPGFGLDEIFGTYSYDIETPDDNEFLKVKVGPETEWPIFEADLPLYAFREILRPYDGAKVIGEFINGEPAVIENRFEKGKTVLVGTLMFQSYLLKGGAWRVFVKELLHSWGVKSAIDIENIPPELWCNIEVGLLEHEDMKTKVIILLNHNREDVDANVKMQGVCSVIDLETGNKLPLEHLDENTYLKTIIKGKSAKVLKAEKY